MIILTWCAARPFRARAIQFWQDFATASGLPPAPAWEEAFQTLPYLSQKDKKQGFGDFPEWVWAIARSRSDFGSELNCPTFRAPCVYLLQLMCVLNRYLTPFGSQNHAQSTSWRPVRTRSERRGSSLTSSCLFSMSCRPDRIKHPL